MFRENKIYPQAAQPSLLFLDKLYPGSNSNHRSVAIEINGHIDIAAFCKAVDLLITRHEMLRAIVAEDGSGAHFHITPVKSTYSQDNWPLKIIDLTHAASASLTTAPRVEDLYHTLKTVREERFIDDSFNLKTGPLWRMLLVQIDENTFQFAMLFSHTIIDEGSIGIIFKDLSALYNQLLDESAQHNLPAIPSLASMNFTMSLSETQRRLDYWKNKLTDLNNINLQTDFLPQQSFRFAGKRKSFSLDKSLTERLKSNVQLNKFSLNQTLTAIFLYLLSIYSNQSDICIGITSANRRHKDIDEKTLAQLVNCFFNSIPLRVAFEEDTSFLNLLTQVKISLGDALKNQLPLDKVFRGAISPETKSSLQTASPFNAMLVFNEEKPTLTLLNTAATYPIELDLGHSKFPYFAINIDKYPDGSCLCFVEYNTDLFNENTISHFINRFKQSLQYVADNPDCTLSSIPLLLEDEKILITCLNQTERLPLPETLVPDFFHQRALAHPDECFVVYHNENGEAERFTYIQIDSLSTQLANDLTQLNVGPQIRVGVCLSRSPHLIIAMLAVLKAGGVVVAIETEKSPLFLHKTNNSDIPIILVDYETQSLFTQCQKPLLNVQSVKLSQMFADTPPYKNVLAPQHPAYIMYTSGTSGEPKGVTLTHQGFANLLHSLSDDLKLPRGTKVICTALPTFDAFWYDILAAMAAECGQLHICFERGRYSPKVLETIIRNEKITMGVFLPSLLDHLDPQLPLDIVLSMGESPHESTLKKWIREDRLIFNGYGLTETGICVSLFPYQNQGDPNLIGQPIRNMQMFILNPANLSLCPLNVPGEIFIAGPGVAQGYIDNDKLTNEKFLWVLFDQSKCSFQRCPPYQQGAIRLYASGDYGCSQLQNDNSVVIKSMGRKDRQIKIHGVRVNLGVVENILHEHPQILDVAVFANPEETSLTAYIIMPTVCEHSMKETSDQIREYFSKTLLPSVAYPKNHIFLSKFPVTQNGKIDVKALPLVQVNTSEMNIKEHLTDLQSKLRTIWAKTLCIPDENISIQLSYNELGGDSLGLVQLEIELNTSLALSSYVGIECLSMSMTIARLSEYLEPLLHTPSLTIISPDIYLEGSEVVFFKRKKQKTTPAPTLSPSPTSEQTIANTTSSYSQ